MNIGFVFTNYNNSTYTKQAINSIISCTGKHSKVVVIVDNDSNTDDVIALREMEKCFQDIHFVFNPKNEGYFSGLNIGLRFIEKNAVDLDCVVVGNNDLAFPSDFINKVEEHAHHLSRYPVISPDIVRLDGVHQNPLVVSDVGFFRKILWDLYYSSYNLSRIMLWVSNKTRRFTERKDYKRHISAGPIAQGYGACYILGPVFFKHFKELWAPSFLMLEEYFLHYQISQEGLEIFYEPGIVVSHHDHATVGMMPSRKLWKLTREAHLIYKQLTRKN